MAEHARTPSANNAISVMISSAPPVMARVCHHPGEPPEQPGGSGRPGEGPRG